MNKSLTLIISSLNGGTANILEKISDYQSLKNKVYIAVLSKNIDKSLKKKINENPNIEILNLFFQNRMNLLNILKFIFIVKKTRSNTIMSFDNTSNFYAYLYTIFFNIKWISSIHGLEGAFTKKWIFINKIIFKKSLNCIVISKAVRNKVIKYNLIKRSKLNLVYNGVTVQKKPLDRKFDNEIKFCLIGNFYSETIKGHYIAIDALKYLPNNFSLILIGSGKYKNKFNEYVELNNLNNQVKFEGFCTPKKIAEVLKSVRCLVAPSKTEAFGISIIESMSYGIPVIANKIGGIPEIIKNNHNGILLDNISPKRLAKAITFLANNTDINRQYGNAAFQDINNKFNIKNMLDSYDQIINY